MDAFEQLAAELLFAEGWWVETSVKVNLTKEEKRNVGRPSAPRWELDVVAYKGATNEILVFECKSFLDSRGVTWRELQNGHSSTRYKLFREPVLRQVVFARLAKQMVELGRCRPNPTVKLGMIAGKISGQDHAALAQHFIDRDWQFYGPDWIRERLEKLAMSSYSNQVSAVVAKLLLRSATGRAQPPKTNAKTRAWERTAPLRMLIKHNPKRNGSAAHARFQNYFESKAKTVGEALDAGVRTDDLRNDLKKGYIEIG